MTKRNRNKAGSPESLEIKQFVIILIVVIVLFVGVYFFTRAFVSKDLFKDKDAETEETKEVEISYDVTTIGMMFTRPYKEYYVLAFDEKVSNNTYYSSIASNYMELENKTKLYLIDMSSAFNKEYLSEEGNSKATKIEEVKIKDGTLIKIKNGKITKYIEDRDEMSKELK